MYKILREIKKSIKIKRLSDLFKTDSDEARKNVKVDFGNDNS